MPLSSLEDEVKKYEDEKIIFHQLNQSELRPPAYFMYQKDDLRLANKT